jgi:hypothetical protein
LLHCICRTCKTDGSNSGVSRVTTTPRDIDSVFGLCTILSKKREGAQFGDAISSRSNGIGRGVVATIMRGGRSLTAAPPMRKPIIAISHV